MISISDRLAMIFGLSGGQAHDAPEGRALLESWDKPVENVPMVMDRAYEGDKTRQLVRDLRMTPVVPPKANRKNPGISVRVQTHIGLDAPSDRIAIDERARVDLACVHVLWPGTIGGSKPPRPGQLFERELSHRK